MITKLLYLFTRTPLHVGAGASVGAIDQPVQRERHTGFPIIPGSSMKGVLRDYLHRQIGPDVTKQSFGSGSDSAEARAGDISFGEARLIAFPVRSARGSFALAVSPLTLRRLARDAGWTDLQVPESPKDMTCLAGNRVVIERDSQKAVALEEYRFKSVGDFPKAWEDKLSSLLQDAVLAGASGRFVLLSDGDLSHFVITACQVNQHVRICHDTGTAEDGGLFNEETVPSETLFYAPLTLLRNAQENPETEVFKTLANEQLIQFGGDGTTGLGFCTVKLH